MFKRPATFVSVNSLDSLSPGSYRELTHIMQGPGAVSSAVVRQFFHEGSADPAAAEVSAVLNDGSVLFRDFQYVAGFGWRDSYGLWCLDLAEHLPVELLDLPVTGIHEQILLLTGTPREVVLSTSDPTL